MNQQKDLINKAIKLKNDEKFEESLKLLEELHKNNPNSNDVKKIFIDVLFEYGDYLNDEWGHDFDKAVKCFKRIIELEPNNYRAWYNLGISYFKLNRNEEALKAYNRAIEIKPDYMYCYYNIGLLHEFNKGDLEIALLYYEKALALNNNFIYALQASKDVRQKLESLKINVLDNNHYGIDIEIVCKKCGNINRLGARFCDKCGERTK
ncbi:MAG: tetratricopeptide repeat protein [Promethearchaeota archaeon]